MARGIGGDRQPSTKAAKFPRRTFFWTRVPKAGRCGPNAVTCSQVFRARHAAYYQGAATDYVRLLIAVTHGGLVGTA